MAGDARPVLGRWRLRTSSRWRSGRCSRSAASKATSPSGSVARGSRPQGWCAVGIDAERAVVGKACVDRLGDGGQLGLERFDGVGALGRKADGGAIGRHLRRAGRPGQQLGTVVGEALAADDEDVAAPQRVGEMDEHADLERAAVDRRRIAGHGRDEGAPALRGEAEIERERHVLAPCVPAYAHLAPGGEQALVLRRRVDLERVEDAEQQRAVARVDWPEQRQVVVLMPGRDRPHALGEGLSTALRSEDRPHARAEHVDEGLLKTAVLGAQRLERLTRGRLRAPDPAQDRPSSGDSAPRGVSGAGGVVRPGVSSGGSRVGLQAPGVGGPALGPGALGWDRLAAARGGWRPGRGRDGPRGAGRARCARRGRRAAPRGRRADGGARAG